MAFYENSIAYQAIMEDILRRPSLKRERINPKEYQYSLGVSSIPVREALIRLGAEDVIDIIPGKGFYTRGLHVERTHETLALLRQNLMELLGFTLDMGDNSVVRRLSRYIKTRADAVGEAAVGADASVALQQGFTMIASETRCQESFRVIRHLSIGAHVALASLLSDAEARAGVSERLRTLAYRLETGEEPLDAAAALMGDLEDRFTRLAETIAAPAIGWWSAHG